MHIDDCVMQKILENRIHDSLVPETKGGDVGKLICFGNLLDWEITCSVFIRAFDFVPRKINRVFGAGHVTWCLYILYSFDSSLSHFFALSASDTELKTHNMGANRTIAYFLLSFCLSAGRVPDSCTRTASNISSHPDRCKQPMWEKTQPSKIHYHSHVYKYFAWNSKSTNTYSCTEHFLMF